MPNWKLTCLICGEEFDGLVRAQKHTMEAHGYTHEDHQRVTSRHDPKTNIWIYTFPDRVDWLQAERGPE